jgi:hypothetical protein
MLAARQAPLTDAGNGLCHTTQSTALHTQETETFELRAALEVRPLTQTLFIERSRIRGSGRFGHRTGIAWSC